MGLRNDLFKTGKIDSITECLGLKTTEPMSSPSVCFRLSFESQIICFRFERKCSSR